LSPGLEDSQISYDVSERIGDPLWTKVRLNLISNPLSVVAGATLIEMNGGGDLTAINRNLLREGLLVAAAYDARIERGPEELIAVASMGEAKTSVLQDYENGRSLELGAICDGVIVLAELRGIAMPLTRHIATLARFKGEALRESRAA
jgi:2-dehydropantoate 2-reductase